jgi:hypothetical protein
MRTVTLVALGWLVSLVVAIAACSAPPKKTAADLPTGSDTGEKCCCKSTPITADDAKPLFESINRMDCSTKQGDCVSDVQCSANSR